VFSVLPHLLRNSIDHGIERPEDRDGKPAEASLSLSFEDSAGQLRICVADDGRGIAVERVAERALALEVVSRGELARMTDAEKLRLIFVGGLSTAAEVSETSGRGVGMDAVEAAVTELGGTIDVHSTRGFGTRFEIAIPR